MACDKAGNKLGTTISIMVCHGVTLAPPTGGKVRVTRAPRRIPSKARMREGGRSLPPGILVKGARAAWRAGWHLLMSQLAPTTADGEYVRAPSAFRADGLPNTDGPRPSYRLYAGKTCPWAHRTMMVAALASLPTETLGVTLLEPGEEGLWEFKGGPTAPGALGCTTLRELYGLCVGGTYSGRATAPLLVQVTEDGGGPPRIVCNESSDIAKLLNELGRRESERMEGHDGLDLYPDSHKDEIDAWVDELYKGLNNGVYRAGFASTQSAKDRASTDVARTLDRIEATLSTSRYLCGTRAPSLADVFLFTTLLRFDAVYANLFGCSLRQVAAMEATYGFLRDMYQLKGVAPTCDIRGTMQQYYTTLFPLNPSGLVPLLPPSLSTDSLTAPHGREEIDRNA